MVLIVRVYKELTREIGTLNLWNKLLQPDTRKYWGKSKSIGFAIVSSSIAPRWDCPRGSGGNMLMQSYVIECLPHVIECLHDQLPRREGSSRA